jgi:hypothetical protein
MHSLPFVNYLESRKTYRKSASGINVCSTLLCNFCLASYTRDRSRNTSRSSYNMSIIYDGLLTKIGMCRQIAVKLTNTKFHENPFRGPRDDTCGQADTGKLTDTYVFATFLCERSKKCTSTAALPTHSHENTALFLLWNSTSGSWMSLFTQFNKHMIANILLVLREIPLFKLLFFCT